MARIAIAGFEHETNTFAPHRASWEDFAAADSWPAFTEGREILSVFRDQNIPISGAMETLQAAGHEIVPLSWCSAPPSSYVETAAYERVAASIIDGLKASGPLDGVYLDLHGAMVVENFEDGEGELLRRVRATVGDQLPVVASLDYHANLTPEMVEFSDALVGFRTYPHIDMAETGSRAAKLLDRLLVDHRPLHKAFRQIDFLIPLVWQCTLRDPARGIFEFVAAMEREGDGSGQGARIVSATHTPGFPPADIVQCGPALVVYGFDKAATEDAADRLAARINAEEGAFTGRLYAADAAVVEALRLSRGTGKPIVLADIQDNPGTGGTSDTVGLLRALMAHGARGAVIGLFMDPAGAAAAVEAGEGAILRRGIGAVLGYAGEKPVEAAWRVARLGNGCFTGTGPVYGGSRFEIGPMAWLVDDESGVSAVLASKRAAPDDQAVFRHIGIEPTTTPILGLKSTVHFRADFEPIAETVLMVRSPGAHRTDPTEFPYRHLRPGIRLGPNGPVHQPRRDGRAT
jgi:microcystin degradation protein MlrC